MRHNSVDTNKMVYHRYYSLSGEIKPLFRGVFHLISLIFFPITLIPLLYFCNSLKELVGIVIYKTSMFICLLVSSLFHIGNWSPSVEKRIQMLDHACISLVVSYSYAIVGSLYMTDTTFIYVVPAVNTVLFYYTAFINSAYKVHTYFINSITVLSYSYLFYKYLTTLEIVLISLTYIQYLIGLYIYNTKILDLYPTVFGHHEIFHLFTVGAFITTFITNLSLVIRN